MVVESKKSMLWTGRVLSALPVLLMVFSAGMKLTGQAMVIEQMGSHYGFSEGVILPIGIVELLCAVIYAVPQTAVLGAILMTGYLGGATVTHLRMGEPWFMPVILGMVAWGGLYLRDPRLRELLPIRR